jgi:hypothetical protein
MFVRDQSGLYSLFLGRQAHERFMDSSRVGITCIAQNLTELGATIWSTISMQHRCAPCSRLRRRVP